MPYSTSSTEFQIGDTVVLENHPFFEDSDKDFTFIAGESLSIPPLMIIIELLIESKSSFEESSGKEIIKKDSFQCKCMWYSNKSGLFEDAWISSRLLKIIPPVGIPLNESKWSYGDSVIFKTLNIELGKKKISLKQQGNKFDEKSKSLSALLSFTSPVLQIIGTGKSEIKEPLIDSKTGDRKRFIPIRLIKCKYFNSIAEKCSEVFIPIEALNSLEKVSSKDIESLKEIIKDKIFLQCKSENPLLKKTVVKPLRIVYKAGSYYLEAEDYLENKISEIHLTNVDDQFEKIDHQFDSLPKFEASRSTLKYKPITKRTLISLKVRKEYLRIKYKDFNDNVTVRTIYDISFMTLKEQDDNDEDVAIDYIKAKCILRNHEDRYFRIDRIQTIQALEIKFGENGKM